MSRRTIKEKIKIALVGSQGISDYKFVEGWFFSLLKYLKLTKWDVVIVSDGGGIGAIAQAIAKQYGIPILIIFPDRDTFGDFSFRARDADLVEEADYFLVFASEESREASFFIKEAQRRGKFVRLIQDGEDKS